jgi:hypothetical protein
MTDPRRARTLGEACANPDGKTYNAFRLLSWLSEVTSPGRGLSEAEVRAIYEEKRRAKGKPDAR